MQPLYPIQLSSNLQSRTLGKSVELHVVARGSSAGIVPSKQHILADQQRTYLLPYLQPFQTAYNGMQVNSLATASPNLRITYVKLSRTLANSLNHTTTFLADTRARHDLRTPSSHPETRTGAEVSILSALFLTQQPYTP